MKHTVFLLLVLCSLLLGSPVSATHTPDAYPRLANYFLKWQLSESEARELAKWDLVVLDMETQVNSAALIKKMREWNPRIVLLAYITSQEIRKDAPSGGSVMRKKLAAGIATERYLLDQSGARQSSWPGTYLLNLRDPAMGEYLAGFVSKEILGTGLWDGVFYDNAWDSITYFVPGKLPAEADADWRTGMKFLYNETRRLAGRSIILVGNGTTRAYQNELNGNMIENFIPSAWTPTMRTYGFDSDRARVPVVNIINANTGNRGGQNRYQEMRFGLASTLLENGAYSFDFGDQDHTQLWWYDEYSVDLGRPTGEAVSARSLGAYEVDVWRRQFDHGLAVVNATNERRTIALGGEYEKIHGRQDTAVNNGVIVSDVMLEPYDGAILLKTFSSLSDALYSNGAFVRFFRADGTHARNGFFAFDQAAAGGETIGRLDLDGNGERDMVRVLRGNKLMADRDDGQPLLSVYPYTANLRGTFSVATVGSEKEKQLLVAPASGSVQPIRVYTRHGERVGSDWWPFGARYGGGIRASEIPGGGVALAKGKGQEPLVAVYDKNRTLIRQWLAYEKTFRGGVVVAAGDVAGDTAPEIVVGSGAGRAPTIKVFDLNGRMIASFLAFSSESVGGISGLALQDADFDGKADIVVISAAP